MTDTKGVTENLGKFLVRRKSPGQSGEDGQHHAEQVMIKILWSGYFVGDRAKGSYHLQMSLTRRPCQKCGPALQSFQHELGDVGYHLDVTARIVSSYSAEGDDIAINVLSALRKKGLQA